MMLIDNLMCPECRGEKFDSRAATDDLARNALVVSCSACGHSMRVIGEFLETEPAGDSQLPYWEAHYGSEDQGRLISALEAGFRNPRVLEAHYPMVRLLTNHLPLPLGSSIELGCGSGAFSLVLKKLGLVREVTLLDYSAASLSAAAGMFERFGVACCLVHSTIEDAPFSPGSFDLALSAGVIEHYVTRQERLGCLKSHLRLGRYSCIQAPVSAPFYWLSRAVFTLVNRGWPFGYERPVTPREIDRLVKSAGALVIGRDHQYFTSFPLFTRAHWLPKPGWYTVPLMNEAAVLVVRN